MSDNTYDVAVIGGGIVGISAAAEISRGANVLLLEAESQPGYHASGRSAAIFAQNYGGAIMQGLTQISEPFFRAPPSGFSEAPLLTPRGLMQIAREDQVPALQALTAGIRGEEGMIWMDGPEAEARAPLLRKGHIAKALLNHAACDIDVHALMQGFLREAKAAGAEIRTKAEVTALRNEGQQWRIQTTKGEVRANIVVNAAGAWADKIAQLAGLRQLGLTPMRRSAITIAAPEGLDVGAMPMLLDVDEAFYVKPEAGKLMASPANETPSAPCDAQPEELDIAICVDRVTTACALDIRRIESRWAGLRTFAPDRQPICGFDAIETSFFWLAGQGGAGVQTSPALARITATKVLGGRIEDVLGNSGLTPENMSPARPALGN